MTQQLIIERRLDRIANEDPDAKVIGWDERAKGPLIRRSNGRVQAISPDGRARARIKASQPSEAA